MVRIIICDDNECMASQLASRVEKIMCEYGCATKIHAYSSREEIGLPILKSCDIALLDIEFACKNYSGIDIAKELRKYRPDAVIIFATNFISYAVQGYEVGAFRYLLKDEMEDKLALYLKDAIARLTNSREVIKIQTNGELIDIPLREILYIESQKHLVIIHALKNGKTIKQYRYYSSMAKLSEELNPLGFLRIHKSFIVNMRHIIKLQCHEAILSRGIVLKVSEKTYAQAKETYLLWKGRMK